MIININDKYFCTECNTFTNENHRCEQWSNVIRIPAKALDLIEEDFEALPTTVYVIQDGVTDCEGARNMYFVLSEEDAEKEVEMLNRINTPYSDYGYDTVVATTYAEQIETRRQVALNKLTDSEKELLGLVK